MWKRVRSLRCVCVHWPDGGGTGESVCVCGGVCVGAKAGVTQQISYMNDQHFCLIRHVETNIYQHLVC